MIFLLLIIIFIASFFLPTNARKIESFLFLIIGGIGFVVSLILLFTTQSYNSSSFSFFDYNPFNQQAHTNAIVFLIIFILFLIFGAVLFKTKELNILKRGEFNSSYSNENQNYNSTQNSNSSSGIEKISLNKPASKQLSYTSGFEFADKFNKIHELKKMGIIDDNEFIKRKLELTNSTRYIHINDSSENFILNFSSTIKENIFTKDDLGKLFDIINLKTTYRALPTESLIVDLSTKDIANKDLISFELESRGYTKERLTVIEGWSTLSKVNLIDLYEKKPNNILLIKIQSLNLDGKLIVKIKKALNLTSDDVIYRYENDRQALLSEYEKFKKDNSISTLTKKTAATGLNKGKSAQSNLKSHILKHKIKYIIALVVVILIIIGFTALKIISTLKPSNSKVESYVTTQLKATGVTPSDFKIKNAVSPGKNLYTVNFSFKEDHKTYTTFENDNITYTYANGSWMPGTINNISSQQCANAALDSSQMKSLVSGQNISGVPINIGSLTLGTPVTDLNAGTESAPFSYTTKGSNYTLVLNGTLNYSFNNNKWVFKNATGVTTNYTLQDFTNAEMISTFVAYEQSQFNTVDPNTCTVTKPVKDLKNGTASATITVSADGTSTPYAVTFAFSLNANPSNAISQAAWTVTNATEGTATEAVVTANNAFDYLNTYLQTNCNTVLYQVSNATGTALANKSATAIQSVVSDAQALNPTKGILTMMLDSNGNLPVYTATLNGKSVLVMIASTLNLYPTNFTGLFVIGTDGTFYDNSQVFSAYKAGKFNTSNLPSFLTSQLKGGTQLAASSSSTALGIGDTFNGVFVWNNSLLSNTTFNPTANTRTTS